MIVRSLILVAIIGLYRLASGTQQLPGLFVFSILVLLGMQVLGLVFFRGIKNLVQFTGIDPDVIASAELSRHSTYIVSSRSQKIKLMALSIGLNATVLAAVACVTSILLIRFS